MQRMAKKAKDRNAVIHSQLKSGMTIQQVADYHGLSKGRISQIASENKWIINSKAIQDRQYQKALIRQDLNVKDQMMRLNEYNISLLSLFQEAVEGDERAKKRLNELGVGDKVSVLLKALKETRESLASYVKMAKDVMAMQDVKEFQDKIIQAIKEVCTKEQTRKIVRRLQEDKPLEKAIKGGR